MKTFKNQIGINYRCIKTTQKATKLFWETWKKIK